MAMFIVDRRLNPGSKSLENRQRFLRRAKALVKGAVKKTSEGRDIKDVLEGGEVSIPLDGMHEPRFRTQGGTRDRVFPGNKKFIEGDILPRSSDGRGGRGSQPGEGDSEDASIARAGSGTIATAPMATKWCATIASVDEPPPPSDETASTRGAGVSELSGPDQSTTEPSE